MILELLRRGNFLHIDNKPTWAWQGNDVLASQVSQEVLKVVLSETGSWRCVAFRIAKQWRNLCSSFPELPCTDPPRVACRNRCEVRNLQDLHEDNLDGCADMAKSIQLAMRDVNATFMHCTHGTSSARGPMKLANCFWACARSATALRPLRLQPSIHLIAWRCKSAWRSVVFARVMAFRNPSISLELLLPILVSINKLNTALG